MKKSVQIKKRYPLAEGFTYFKETFTFAYQETESAISSEDDVEESTGWTKDEVLEILRQTPINHPAIVAFVDVKLDSDIANNDDLAHPNLTSTVSPQSVIHVTSEQEVKKDILNTNSFFMSKKQAMGASVILLDSIFMLGLAITGLLSAQHLALILFGLAATSVIAAAGTYYYTPQLN